MNKEIESILSEIVDLHQIPQGAYNIRKDGKSIARNSTEEIEIIPKKNKPGIDIYIKANTKNKSVHIPVLITKSGLSDLVYNDFYIGENCDVTIVAGCGIHNTGKDKSEHDGIHTFHLAKNSHIKYIEKHIGLGSSDNQKVLNPTTKLILKENSTMEMITEQIKGVTSSIRKTNAKLYKNAKLIIKEKILTTNEQTAKTIFDVKLLEDNSSCEIISRSVAKDDSIQDFVSNMTGVKNCFGHVECDGLLVDNSKIFSTPKISALSSQATLVHEAAIGKIAGEQLVKLETLGLNEEQAKELIIKGFLS